MISVRFGNASGWQVLILRDLGYNEAVEELNIRLPSLIALHGGFMPAWHAITDIMMNHDETLRRNNRLVHAVQFYMYWNCDFGRSDEDED